jgi:hypothetical protein
MEKLINDKEFMDEFVSIANESFMFGGDYESVYDHYEDKLSDKEILTLLDYCEEKDLLED